MRALLIGPDPGRGEVVAETLRAVFPEEHVFARHVRDAAEVMRGLRQAAVTGIDDSPDLIVLDITVATKRGMDLLWVLRTEMPRVPMVVLTGTSRAISELVSRKSQYAPGTLAYLPDAFTPQDLRWAVDRVVGFRPTSERATIPWGPNSPTSHVVRELHDPETGRLDARRIAEYLAIPLSNLAGAIEIKRTTVHKTPASIAAQEKLAPIAWIIGVLVLLFRERETVLAWLNSPHPDLGTKSPMSFILEGRATAISEMLEAALAGQPS